MTHTGQGYRIYPQVFERAEMVGVTEALAAAPVERTKAGARHVLSVPAVRELSSDARLLTIASQFIGATPIAFRATLFDKSPAANWLVAWHQDTALPLRNRLTQPGWGPWSTKAGVLYAHAPAWALERVVALRVSLDDSITTNGPLRVLPDTHRSGVLTDEQISRMARDLMPVACVALSGDVVAMRPLTIHASSKSMESKPRRVLHLEYAASASLGMGIELAVG
jgi:ectoine hydroxylase-related dioxygenase (phytanoyl-CoA dioxygenase family)